MKVAGAQAIVARVTDELSAADTAFIMAIDGSGKVVVQAFGNPSYFRLLVGSLLTHAIGSSVGRDDLCVGCRADLDALQAALDALAESPRVTHQHKPH